MQLLEFLRAALSFDQYASLLPEPQALLEIYGLDATTILTLHRPLLSRIQPPAVTGTEEEDGEIDEPKPMDIDTATAGNEPSLNVMPIARLIQFE